MILTLKKLNKYIKNGTPILLRGSYLFNKKPTTITKVLENGWYVKVEGSDDVYEVHRIKKYKAVL